MTVAALFGLAAVVAGASATPSPTPSATPSPAEAAPPAWSEQIVVSATRSPERIGDTPASVTVMNAAELSSTAAVALDDALRQVPGFSLFRRTGSRFANPTAQGVSLRGVGASGASRAVALFDGVPVADPFGGWIYWTRIPRLALERVEVVRGGGSSLYGTDALGGVVSFVPKRPTDRSFVIEASTGTAGSTGLSATAGDRTGRFGGALSVEAFRTDGQYVVHPDERGPVDARAGVDFGNADLMLETTLGAAGRLFARGSYFDEDRDNGTPLQLNDTRSRQITFGSDLRPSRGSASIRAWFGSQTYRQDFSAIGAGRASETLSRKQRTPSSHFGLTSQFSRGLGAKWALVGGLDLRVVDGETDEVVYAAASNRATSRVVAGGRAAFGGVFVETTYAPSNRFLFGAGARLDEWRHSEGSSVTTTLSTGAPSGGRLADRSENAFSPRVSALYRAGPRLSLTASASRGFRAPTLNELYRSFRVGNVVTQANAALGPETATGGEIGLNLATRDGRARGRVAGFASSLRDPVSNLTIASTPELVTRRRENLGRSSSRGLEIETTFAASKGLTFGLSYAHTRSRVENAPGTTLAGRALPQTPRHHVSANARYSPESGFTLAIQARATGSQFDDDLNALPLRRAVVADALASVRIRGAVEVFAAVENVFDARVETGRAGVTTVGPPRAARAGIRVRNSR